MKEITIVKLYDTQTTLFNINNANIHYINWNENNINDSDMKDTNIIINITNNIDITKYLSSICYKYDIALFDYTLYGPKMETHVTIPYITQISSLTSAFVEKSFPLCVINNFPSHYEHVILYIKELCGKLSCNTNPIQYAYNLFLNTYYYEINKLIESTEEKIWETKIKPHPIMFDINNTNHMLFIYNVVELFDNTISKKHINEMINIIVHIDKKPFTINLVTNEIKITEKYILFIDIAVKIRCENYNLLTPTINDIIYECGLSKPTDYQTNVAYQYMAHEVTKYINNNNTYVNTILDFNTGIKTENIPTPATFFCIAGKNINIWKKFIHTDDMTLDIFRKYYEKLFEIKITTITNGCRILYSDFIDYENNNKKLSELSLDNTTLTLMDTLDNEIPEIQINIK